MQLNIASLTSSSSLLLILLLVVTTIATPTSTEAQFKSSLEKRGLNTNYPPCKKLCPNGGSAKISNCVLTTEIGYGKFCFCQGNGKTCIAGM